jgi:hypothetical protein
MDEYIEAYYTLRPSARSEDVGDLTARLALRTALQCKPFKFILDTLLPGSLIVVFVHKHFSFESCIVWQFLSFSFFLLSLLELLTGKYVPFDNVIQHRGGIRNLGVNKCVDTLGNQHPGQAIGMYHCHNPDTQSMTQAFILSIQSHIRMLWDTCLCIGGDDVVALGSCNAHATQWVYDEDYMQLRVPDTDTCMTVRDDKPVAAPCQQTQLFKWVFSGKLNA